MNDDLQNQIAQQAARLAALRKAARKEKMKAYSQRPEVKEKMKAYFQRPEVKEKMKAYSQRPEVKLLGKLRRNGISLDQAKTELQKLREAAE